MTAARSGAPRRGRDLRGRARLRRQLALGGRALLPAHRQPTGRGTARDHDRLPRASAAHVLGHPGRGESLERDHLTFDPADPGRISASFLAKVPGPTMELRQAQMSFRYEDSFTGASALEAYERLIHDAMIGDRTLFTRADGIERLWEVSMPMLSDPPPLQPYAAGSWGPDATELIAPRRWHLPHEHG